MDTYPRGLKLFFVIILIFKIKKLIYYGYLIQ